MDLEKHGSIHVLVLNYSSLLWLTNMFSMVQADGDYNAKLGITILGAHS